MKKLLLIITLLYPINASATTQTEFDKQIRKYEVQVEVERILYNKEAQLFSSLMFRKNNIIDKLVIWSYYDVGLKKRFRVAIAAFKDDKLIFWQHNSLKIILLHLKMFNAERKI